MTYKILDQILGRGAFGSVYVGQAILPDPKNPNKPLQSFFIAVKEMEIAKLSDENMIKNEEENVNLTVKMNTPHIL